MDPQHKNKKKNRRFTPPHQYKIKQKIIQEKTELDLYKESVFNLSKIQLTNPQIKVLGKGLSFAPTPPYINNIQLAEEIHTFTRRLRLIYHFRNQPEPDTQTTTQTTTTPKFKKSCWNPPKGENICLDNICDTVERLALETKPVQAKYSNISPQEREAIKQLKQNQDIIIKPADKGSGVVVMNKEDYMKEAHRQLSDNKTYKLLDQDPTDQFNSEVNREIKILNAMHVIDDKTRYQLVNNTARTAQFYMLPKMHKANHPGRPIISANECPTELISKYVDLKLQPIAKTRKSYLRDTQDFLSRIQQYKNLPENTLLVTADVQSLYTNITHQAGITAVKNTLIKEKHSNLEIGLITRLIRLILTKNCFNFNNKSYLQIQGTAMGTKMAPSYAIIYMAHLEESFLEQQETKPMVWLRYIDDIFMIWTHGEEKLNTFFTAFNNFAPPIKLDWEISKPSINFLDTTCSIQAGKIETTLYTKPTDRHQYLYHSSCHPSNQKKGIPFSQALRIRRICSSTEEYIKHTNKLKTHLVNRGYHKQLVNNAIQKALEINRQDLLQIKQNKQTNEKIIPMVTTYHPNTPATSINKATRDLLESNKILNDIFKEYRFITAFKRPQNLRDILIRSKFTENPQNSITVITNPGTHKCNRNRCRTCHYIDSSTNFQVNTTKHTIKQHFTCTSTNLVYLITCNQCPAFYIGETLRRLADRIGDHIRSINKNDPEKPVAVHFNSNNHNITNMQIKGLSLNMKDNPHRKQLERLWIYRTSALKTPGLNLKDW